MSYNKINNITGWLVCLIACTVYMMTKEATVSFWDCGEFIAGAAKLEVVHSPGAPLFLMLGRFFVILFGGYHNAALAINTLSALSSGFTILFLFWTITHFAKRIFLIQKESLNTANMIAIMGAGIVGALAYTFSDTFWFSAVEGEVYAMSSFLTAFVFWAILKWEDRLETEGAHADRWVLLIALVMGLSIGVHLLNLLTIPAIVMVYYFKKYTVSVKGTILAFLMGCIITGIVQYGVIQFVPVLASKMDILFVNSFGLPFNSGVFFTIIVLAVACYFLIKWADKNSKYFVKLATLSFIFIMIGYSAFFQTIIRSNADVPIDMTNPDNAISLIKYLQREQYGKVPLFIGPDYNSKPRGMKDGTMQYWKGEKRYEELGEKQDEYDYDADQLRFFPRIWDGNDPNHANFYKNYLGLDENERASTADNLKFFMGYQVNQMWWRYFCWNYIGRQNDIQNIQGEPHNSNWISGIKFLDKPRVGDIDKMPIPMRESKARNELYFLPFILGLLGLFFQYKHDRQNTFIVTLLFFFTGLAIVLYLNNTPIQPRERDYAYAGATYAFAIWIGLGVLMVSELLKKLKLGNISPSIATVLCVLAVPVLMASKEWDDHDRSKKTLAHATAINFLESCEPNAILLTEGDNDTYPLWYAQEVEGIRQDVRMINISLLGIDWYIDQLQYAVNKAAPVDLVWKPEQYRGEKRNYIQYFDSKAIAQDKYVSLKEILQWVGDDRNMQTTVGGKGLNYFPVKNFYIPVDKSSILKNGVVPHSDSAAIVDQVRFTMPRDVAYKNDLAILNIIAANAWKRPIYFANSIDPDHYEGLSEYLQLEGLAFKLVPIRTEGSTANTPLRINTEKCMDLVLNKFQYGGADRGDVYFDQTNRRMLNTPRVLAFQLADHLLRNERKEDAIKILNHVMTKISDKSFPIGMSQEDRTLILITSLYIKAGDKENAKKMLTALMQFVDDEVAYTQTLSESKKGFKKDEIQFELTAMNFLANEAISNQMEDIGKPISDKVNSYAGQFMR